MIAWSTNFATGIARVDSDHQNLISILNELEDALAQGRGSRVIDETLAKLARYAEAHFLYEEGCMHRHQCPTAAANKQAHQEFSRMIGDSRRHLTAGNSALLARQIHVQLSDWLVSHVLTIDSALRGCKQASGG